MPSDGAAPEPHHHVVELAELKPTLIRAALLLLETAVIPTLLLYACTVTVGSMWVSSRCSDGARFASAPG